MIVNVLSEVRNALLADSTLLSLIGGPRVYSVYSPDSVDFPYITIQEVGNNNIEFGDNSATRAQINVQVDVWSKNDYTNVVSRVDDILTGIGYERYFAIDLYEFDTRVLHKPLRYWIAKELN